MSQAKKKQELRDASELQQVIKTDLFDNVMFDSIAHGPKMQDLIETPETEGLTRDAFSSFFKFSPQIDEEAPMVQRDIISQLHQMQEYKDLVAGTQTDSVTSGLSTLQFAPELIEQYKKIKKQVEEKQKEAKKQGNPGPQNIQEAIGDEGMSGLRQAMRKGLEAAQEQSDEWGETKAGWGIEDAELEQMDPAERLKLAEELTKARGMKNIAELAGRFANIVQSSAATTYTHGVDEIVDIGLGRDLGRILPTEFIKLRQNKALFYNDYLEGKLMQYEVKGVENLGKGPIQICVDKSGSMGGACDEWATAITMAFMQLATKQKRAFGYIAFNSRVTHSRFFPNDETIGISDKMKLASVSCGGGTSFEAPLREAMNQRKNEKALKPSDIVFITDDECQVSPEFLKEFLKFKHETGVRVFGISVTANRGYYGGGNAGYSLEAFCDQIAVLNDLNDLELVKKAVSQAAADFDNKPKAKNGI